MLFLFQVFLLLPFLFFPAVVINLIYLAPQWWYQHRFSFRKLAFAKDSPIGILLSRKMLGNLSSRNHRRSGSATVHDSDFNLQPSCWWYTSLLHSLEFCATKLGGSLQSFGCVGHRILIIPFMLVLSSWLINCYWIGRVKEDPFSWASVLGKDTKKNLRSYPWENQVYWRKKLKNTSRDRWAKPREALVPEWWGTMFSRESFYIDI